MIIFLCIIACVAIYFVLQFIGKKEDGYGNTQAKAISNSNYSPKIVRGNYFSEISVQEKNEPLSDEEIMKSAAFQQTLQKAKDTMKWMTFAGGTDPILPPLIKKPFDQPYSIIFEKQGYDLWTEHYRQYVNGTVWEDREKGLSEFYNDLFKAHAEEVKAITNIEYIADYLIEFEDISGYDSNFILRYTLQLHCQPEWGTPQRVRDLYVRELR